MPDIDDIERRLRLPAPDEPMFLPALELPWGEPGSRVVRTPIRAGRSGASFGVMSPRLAFVVLLLLAALIGAIITGALRLDRLRGPLDPDHGFAGRGVTFALPDDWIRLTPEGPSDGSAMTALVASNAAVEGCSPADLPSLVPGNARPSGNEVEFPLPSGPNYAGVEDQIFACVLDRPMQPGETRVALSNGLPQEIGVGPIESFDAEAWYGSGASLGGAAFYLPNEANGWTETIDGMPAKVVVVPGTDPTGPDEIRTWGVFDPRFFGNVWFIRFGLRGPGLEALRAEADDMARSLRFDDKPAPLAEDDRDALLASAIDALDREARVFRGSRMYGCFPRQAGEQHVQLTDGPGGPLLEPVDVTCTTTIETTPLGVWHATLIVSWDPTADRPAGRWGWEVFFGSDPSLGAQGELEGNLGTVFPGLDGDLPAPLDEPLVIPIGSIVQVLPPGIDQSHGPTQALYQDPNPTIGEDQLVYEAQPGRRFAVVGGPVSHHDTDWYLVEDAIGTSYPTSWAWLPANDGTQPLVRVVEPVCPTSRTIDDILALLPAERVACFGDGELTLEPVVALRVEDGQGLVTGTPPWLAAETEWRLYGEAGPTGVDGAIAVTFDPSVGDDLPTGPPLRVRGHFDDPAAATCERTFPEGWGGPTETPDMQHLRCRELFVVTAVEERSAP